MTPTLDGRSPAPQTTAPHGVHPAQAALRALLAALAGLTIALTMTTSGCRSEGGCRDGMCACPAGDSCDLGCPAPPCHVECAGDNPMCDAVCANGTCTCGNGSNCSFSCQAPPCHVTCAARSSCDGTCANGQCVCGAGSSCTFTCSASPCHTTCAAGARCVVLCPAGLAGTQACDIVDCAAGAPMVCPGGNATTCGAPCP